MTNDRTSESRADASKSELTEEQLNIVSGGKWFEIVSFEHSVKSPRDAASGLATGRRTHKRSGRAMGPLSWPCR